ncbi:Hypothetical predicted protein, partial [Pelobates cultripes]
MVTHPHRDGTSQHQDKHPRHQHMILKRHTTTLTSTPGHPRSPSGPTVGEPQPRRYTGSNPNPNLNPPYPDHLNQHQTPYPVPLPKPSTKQKGAKHTHEPGRHTGKPKQLPEL